MRSLPRQKSVGFFETMTRRSQAWVVDVNMGYGHSRAAFALKDISGGEVLSANDYQGIPAHDRKLWRQSRELYETISRLRPLPLVGGLLFEALDRWQEIPSFYPRRDLSRPNLQLRQLYAMIRRGLGKHLMAKLSEDPKPLITTFFLPAFCADFYDYPGDIWCVTTDADVSRTWAPFNPQQSRIKYLASNGRVVERLKLYGVRDEHIFLTGFPLPKELIGGKEAETLKDQLSHRLCNLDPQGIFTSRYHRSLRAELGPARCRLSTSDHPLTVTYCVGGAGAQRQLGVTVLNSLKTKIVQHHIRLVLMAGVRKEMIQFFKRAVIDAGLKKELGTWVLLPEYASRQAYFQGFTEQLMTTDILWTKPSELSFYCAVGIAVIMAPPIGSQEEFNRTWLQYVGGGFSQNDPRFTDEWLFDWIASGGVARMAWNGYIEAPTHGTYRIEEVVMGGKSDIHPLPLIV